MTADISAVLRDIAQDIEGEAPHYAELLRLAAERIELLDERTRLLLAILREYDPNDSVFRVKEIDGARQFPQPVTFRSALETDPE